MQEQLNKKYTINARGRSLLGHQHFSYRKSPNLMSLFHELPSQTDKVFSGYRPNRQRHCPNEKYVASQPSLRRRQRTRQIKSDENDQQAYSRSHPAAHFIFPNFSDSFINRTHCSKPVCPLSTQGFQVLGLTAFRTNGDLVRPILKQDPTCLLSASDAGSRFTHAHLFS